MARAPSIRIVAGIAGGRVLATLSGSAARPTAASVREALVNILRPRLPGARVLDLFAGYGCVGLEFLSSGAAWAVFVESDGRRAALLRQNVNATGFHDQSQVRQEKASVALEQLAGQGFDVIFADPPYLTGDAPRILELLAQRPTLLAPGGVVVLQHATREPLPERSGGLKRGRERRTGETTLSFYELSGEAP